MTNPGYRTPEQFAPADLTEEDFAAYNRYENALRAESDPDFPHRPIADTRAALLEVPSFLEWTHWRVRAAAGDQVVATAQTGVIHGLEGNEHVALVEVGVIPEARRRGLGTVLLHLAARRAADLDRRMLMINTNSAVPAGDRFLEEAGAEMGLAAVTNQVLIADLDRDLLSSWIGGGDAEYETVFWDGPYPEDMLDGMVAVRRAMNDQPLDDLEIDDINLSADQLREMEAMLAARNIERWTSAAVHTPTGEVAGFTEVFWNPSLPHLIQQGDTGVDPAHRGRNLGRRLKAEMAWHVIGDRPAATAIRTGNAGSNAPMLKINTEMGFVPYRTGRAWQLSVDAALEWCAARDPIEPT